MAGEGLIGDKHFLCDHELIFTLALSLEREPLSKLETILFTVPFTITSVQAQAVSLR